MRLKFIVFLLCSVVLAALYVKRPYIQGVTGVYVKTLALVIFDAKTVDTNKNTIQSLFSHDSPILIAHAGGAIDGRTYTNSQEALLNAISNKYTFIELDLRKTSDGHIVAVHEWSQFRSMIDIEGVADPLELNDFIGSKIYGQYNTLTVDKVNGILTNNKEIVLVTDKIDDFKLLAKTMANKNRIVVEVFSVSKYNEAIDNGFSNVALNIDLRDRFIVDLLELNHIKGVTYNVSMIDESHPVVYANASKINELNIVSLGYTSNDMDFICTNKMVTAFYTDFLNPSIKCRLFDTSSP